MLDGKDITIVAVGSTVHMAVEAAEVLKAEGISAEVIDLRTIKPLDTETVMESVLKTGALLAVDEDYGSFGTASEIISKVSQGIFSKLKTAPVSITSPDTPVPYSQGMEKYSLPDKEKIINTVREMLKR